jgi:hypothetical protein
VRLSLSVPDALWLRACQARPATPPSRLVRAALEHLLEDAEAGFVPGPPPGAGERLRRLERRLRSEALTVYDEGYETGLDLVDTLEWWAVERLAAELEGDGPYVATFKAGLVAALRHCAAGEPVRAEA